MPKPLPHLAITLGDPGGIGPEVIVKALAQPGLSQRARFTIIGLNAPLTSAATVAGISPYWSTAPNSPIRLVEPVAAFNPLAKSTLSGGDASFQFCLEAIRRAKLDRTHPDFVNGVVTAPISKEAWHMAGHHYPGHTELFAQQFGITDFGMFFAAPKLKVILATVHIPLSQVPTKLTTARVLTTIRLGERACRDLGITSPRLAVCGLNPHAGENGLLGTEDDSIIAPAIRAAQQESINARGPFPADTIFLAAMNGKYDLVVAMYHDQGLIPVKLLSRDTAVNVTVGLPTIRTSPDHGTAFDIAGKNLADPGSMLAAIDLAIAMASRS